LNAAGWAAGRDLAKEVAPHFSKVQFYKAAPSQE